MMPENERNESSKWLSNVRQLLGEKDEVILLLPELSAENRANKRGGSRGKHALVPRDFLVVTRIREPERVYCISRTKAFGDGGSSEEFAFQVGLNGDLLIADHHRARSEDDSTSTHGLMSGEVESLYPSESPTDCKGARKCFPKYWNWGLGVEWL